MRGTTALILENSKTALQTDQQEQDMFLELPGRTTHGSFVALQHVLEEACVCSCSEVHTEVAHAPRQNVWMVVRVSIRTGN